MKKLIIIIGISLTALLLVVLFVRANSFNIAIYNAGYSLNSINCLENDFNDNKNEFKVIKTNSKSGLIVLAYIEKNRFGFWKIRSSCEKTDKDDKLVQFVWMNSAGFKRFNFDDDINFETEWHHLYYGENAIKLIEFKERQLPYGVAINVNQAEETYIIHLTSYANTDVLNKIDMQSILLDEKFIK